MSDWAQLYAIVVLIYLTDCLLWAPFGGVVFSTWTSARWSWKFPPLLWGNRHGALCLRPPFPPLGLTMVATQELVSFAPQGLSAPSAVLHPDAQPPRRARTLSFETIATIELDSKNIFINGQFFLKASSLSAARWIASLIHRFRSADSLSARAHAIEESIRQSFDASAAQRRFQELLPLAKPLRILANSLFLYLFVLGPLLFWSLGPSQFALPALVLLLGLTVTTAVLYFRAHRQLLPHAREDRWAGFCIMLLAPPTAIRAADWLARDAFCGWHPLALMHLLPAPAVHQFLQVLLRLLAHAPERNPTLSDPLTARIHSWYLDRLRAAAEAFAATAHIALGPLLAPPPPLDNSVRAYCPRCLAQFVRESGCCSDCSTVPIRSFAAHLPEQPCAEAIRRPDAL